jgi:hypothetical protein
MLFNNIFTPFTANPSFFTMRFQINLATFLIGKIVDKVKEINVFIYILPRSTTLIGIQSIDTTFICWPRAIIRIHTTITVRIAN